MIKLDFNKIKNLIIKKNIINEIFFDDIDWKIQSANKNNIIFIQTSNGNIFNKKYEKEILKSQATIITNNNDVYDGYTGNKILTSDLDFLEIRKKISDLLYGECEQYKFKKIGVTGTNGKTSTVKIFEQICQEYNKSCFSIGTLGLFSNTKFIKDFNLTSPDYIDIRKCFNEFKDYEFGIFEVSSHALIQNRFYKIDFDIGVWTNITQDHLDFHKNMQNYFQAKFLITKHINNHPILLSEDMKNYEEEFKGVNYRIIKKYNGNLSKNTDADFFRKNLALSLEAFSILSKIKIENFEFLKPIEGRFNKWTIGSNEIIIDFAHTPDALENLCRSIEKNKKRLILIFGCGGNRDKTKRPIMGSIADKYADEIILTVDNPRDEDPNVICTDISAGIKNTKYLINLDRKEAIQKTITSSKNSIIVIAGKGHENYIEIKGIKHSYSDVGVVEEFLND